MIPRGRRRWWAWDERGAGVARGGRDQGLVRGKRGPQHRTPLSTSPARRLSPQHAHKKTSRHDKPVSVCECLCESPNGNKNDQLDLLLLKEP